MDVIACGKVVLFCWIRQLCWTATSDTPSQRRSVRRKETGERRGRDGEIEKEGGRGGRIREDTEEKGERGEKKKRAHRY